MKKLKDLKENECIKVSTLKEAKYFIKKLKWKNDLSPNILMENFIANEGNGFIVWINFKLDVVLPASDFIKPKTSTKRILKEIKKEVKYLGDVVANMNRAPLCTSLGVIEFPFEGNVTDPNQIEVIETKELTEHLEVGKWYKCNDPFYDKMLAFTLDVDNVTNTFCGYGFDSSGVFSYPDGFVWGFTKPYKASKEEIETALKNEAKSRGFDQGVKCKCLQLGAEVVLQGHFEWNGDALVYVDTNDIYVIFHDGDWAEIIEQPKEIDFSNGKLFEYTSMSEGLVVMIDLDNSHNKNTVLATCVQNNSSHTWCRLGESRHWEKDRLKLFKDEITLKND